MKKLLIILAILVITFIIMLFILSLLTNSESAAGIAAGKLTQCPDKPNCVCSEYPNDTAHAIAPIKIPAGMEDNVLPLIKETIQELGGEIQNKTDAYLAATYTSELFRFTDDVEIRVDSNEGVIHIRSASRAGYGDMGANQARVKTIRDLFEQKIDSK